MRLAKRRRRLEARRRTMQTELGSRPEGATRALVAALFDRMR
jgi:hypothetical protein